MIDKVRPLKIENTTDGSQDDLGFPTEVNPSEDHIACAGLAFFNSEGHRIYRDPTTGEIFFLDPINGQLKLSQLYGGGFGNDFLIANDASESSTTSTTFVQKLRLTTPVLAAANYLIQTNIILRSNLNNKIAEARVQVDDVTTIHLVETRSGFYNQVGNIGYKIALSAGSHFVDIDYRNIDGVAFIKDTLINLWRVP